MLPASGVELPDLLFLLFTTMNRQIYFTIYNACLYIVATQFATGVEAEGICNNLLVRLKLYYLTIEQHITYIL